MSRLDRPHTAAVRTSPSSSLGRRQTRGAVHDRRLRRVMAVRADEVVESLPERRVCRVAEEVAERGLVAEAEERRYRGARARCVDEALDGDEAVDGEKPRASFGCEPGLERF